MATSARAVAAIDQGTTSTRCILFDHEANVLGVEQFEHTQHLPRPGWVEHDALEIWDRTRAAIRGALARARLGPDDVAAVGITNQRETTVVWDRRTGIPIAPAIVWQDVRTQQICDSLGALGGGPDRYRDRVGLPIATYFAGPKARWILDAVDGARVRAEAGELAFGTVDSWLAWNLTGGPSGGVHVTDATNASRTLMMDLETLAWDLEIVDEVGVPLAALPQIRSSSEIYGHVRGVEGIEGLPIGGILGDQQAALFGQACFAPGDAKATYGTGNFVLLNTGIRPVISTNGLISTVGYVVKGERPTYALEGSIAVTGSLIQWLQDNLGMISSASEAEALAKSVDDTGGAYLVPAFSGLFAPRWRADARGTIVGLTRYVTRAHLARAALEATAYQTREVVDAMNADFGRELESLKVDGGMVSNDFLMQFQADQLGVPVIRPRIVESTALGAAFAAGLAVGFWASTNEIAAKCAPEATWLPRIGARQREAQFRGWQKAVERSLDWA